MRSRAKRRVAPTGHREAGKITAPAVLAALAIGVASYASVKYLPLYRDFSMIKASVSETGQRAITMRDRVGARQWFDEQMRAGGFDWLRASSLYWQPIDRDHLDVGVRYEVEVHHPVGSQTLVFSWYCTATAEGCGEFVPSFSR